MQPNDSKIPSLCLTQSVELTLFLIKEELKSRKFFNTLQVLGLDDSYYQPHLDELILVNVGLVNDSNETFDFYYSIMEKYSHKIEPDINSITTHALNAYIELINEQRRSSALNENSDGNIRPIKPNAI